MTLAAKDSRTPIMDALRRMRASIRNAGLSHESDVLAVRLSPDMGRRFVSELAIAGCDRVVVGNAVLKARALFHRMEVTWPDPDDAG